MIVEVKQVRAGAILPVYQSDMAAGLDLAACIDEPIVVFPGGVAKIPTGIAIHIASPNHVGLMFPRSGLGAKGLVLGNLTGVIDADYQGEINVIVWNRNVFGGMVENARTINPGDRIAQLVIAPIARPRFAVVNEFSQRTERGESGFGSTGVR